MAETPRGDGAPDPTASPGSRSAQARAMHDNGQYRDKIPVADPAMSPLGTDSEAGGARAGEGSMEPLPADGLAPANHHPPGHSRGEAPGKTKVWGMSITIALIILAIAAALIAAAF